MPDTFTLVSVVTLLAALGFLALLLGRLLTTIFKIALVAAFVYLLVTRVDFSTTSLCRPGTLPDSVQAFLCR